MAVVIRRPASSDTGSPYGAIGRVAPIAIGVQVFITDHVGRDVLGRRDIFHAVPRHNKGVEIVRLAQGLDVRRVAGVVEECGLAGMNRETLAVGSNFYV